MVTDFPMLAAPLDSFSLAVFSGGGPQCIATPPRPRATLSVYLDTPTFLPLLPQPELPVFRESYAINHNPTPNWLGHLALAGLILISNPLVAEKILLSVYILALPLAVRYAFRAIRLESAPLALLR